MNGAAFLKALDRHEERVLKLFRGRVRHTVSEALRRLLAKTPVFTGGTVASYVTSTTGATAVHPGWAPVEATSQLPLGAEKNRPQAEAVPLAKLAALNFDDPFQVFTITNANPAAAGLEAGELPGNGKPSRSPQGMFRVTNQELIALLQAGKI